MPNIYYTEGEYFIFYSFLLEPMTTSCNDSKAISLGLCVLGAGILGGLGLLGWSVIKANNPTPNTITVSGEAQVAIVPNYYKVSFSVSRTGDTNKIANDAAQAELSKINDILDKYNVADSDRQTSNVNFSTNRERDDKNSESVEKGKQASYMFTTTIRAMDQLGEVLSDLAELDLELGGGVLGNDDEATTYSKAREQAFANLKAKAQEYADLGGVSLGKLISLDEYQNASYDYDHGRLYSYSISASESDYDFSVGQEHLTVRLGAVFAVK